MFFAEFQRRKERVGTKKAQRRPRSFHDWRYVIYLLLLASAYRIVIPLIEAKTRFDDPCTTLLSRGLAEQSSISRCSNLYSLPLAESMPSLDFPGASFNLIGSFQ